MGKWEGLVLERKSLSGERPQASPGGGGVLEGIPGWSRW